MAADERTSAHAQSPDSPAWPWPNSLDALIAAPLHHALLFENSRVRVLDTRAAPPQSEPPKVLWSGPLAPHSLENVGPSEIHIISVELKDEAA